MMRSRGIDSATRLVLPQRTLIALLVLFFSGAYVAWAVCDFAASRLAVVPASDSLKKAVRLAPGNAEYLARLGRWEFFAAQRPQESADHLRQAIRLNPWPAQYELDLASALAALGDSEGQRRALDRALGNDPTDPRVAWEAANWSLVRGDIATALARFRVVIQYDPENTYAALDLCWHSTHDVHRILETAVPPQNAERLAFLEYLYVHQELAAAKVVWQAVAASGEAVQPAYPLSFISALISAGQWDDAGRSWKQLQTLDPQLRAYNPEGNLITNPRFEEPLLNSGFDWSVNPPAGVTLNTDTTELKDGGRSLLVEFSNSTALSAGVSQTVLVAPQKRYSFTANWKAYDLRSLAPPRWVVRDAATKQPLFTSDTIVGSTSWRSVRSEIPTGAQTRALEVLLMRDSSAPISGKVFLDDVSLGPVAGRERQP
jgi:tetratricopeptide (TPR) repeat protein